MPPTKASPGNSRRRGSDNGRRSMFIIPWSEGAAANGASRLHIRTATERDVDGLAEHFARL
jgi:hypothetical protein